MKWAELKVLNEIEVCAVHFGSFQNVLSELK